MRLAQIILAVCCTVTACDSGTVDISSTLIVNARVIDGTGAPAMQASVRIDGDKIVAVGRLDALRGESVIDATGLVLAPGFIDPHSHADSDLENYRHMPGILSQGITTIARGLDGSFSIDDGFTFQPVSEFNRAFEAQPAAVNLASFAAHGTIRSEVMGDDYRREATADEIKAMQALVAADMEAGALGLATGLEYEPGIYSSTEEIVKLASTASAYGGTYSSHM
ncbi:MAG: amidohydrolase family protein, partial [Gammaproteobacteria bacterium]|nr:amidohydrolase family protein [Gammaproteobacteria bacterium]